MVAATSGELDAWRTRDLRGTKYTFLYLHGANFSVRRGTIVERLPFLCVIGVRTDDENMEALAIEVGDREQKALWSELFRIWSAAGWTWARSSWGAWTVCPGSRPPFRAAFPNARTQRLPGARQAQRAQARRLARARRLQGRSRSHLLRKDPKRAARNAFVELLAKWKAKYAGAVNVIERDLDSLLRFFQWEERYWPSLRTTKPVKRGTRSSSAERRRWRSRVASRPLTASWPSLP